jgi:hypothetical protein
MLRNQSGQNRAEPAKKKSYGILMRFRFLSADRSTLIMSGSKSANDVPNQISIRPIVAVRVSGLYRARIHRVGFASAFMFSHIP